MIAVFAASTVVFAGLWLWERQARKAERAAMWSTFDKAIRSQVADIATCVKMLESA